ncbi:MAG: hypothetical protein KDK76_06710 [Chlamydiia bacterium]|nr:hypothetical protein [Chlamydiia bacterium]
MNLQIINVVWGQKYIQTFLELSLPAQLSYGNLRDLKTQAHYIIYTTEEGQKLIEASQIFKQLQHACHVIFRIISFKVDTCPFKILLKNHSDAIKQGNKTNSPLIFLSPDSIVSTGTFCYCENAINKGIRLIAICSARMSLEKYIPIALKKKDHEGVVTWKPKELAIATVQNLHHRGKCLVMEGDKISTHPSQMYWKLDENNLLAKAYHLHPILLWPEKKNVYPKISADGKNFLERICPNLKKWEIITDCNNISLFEISSDKQFTEDTKHPKNPFWFKRWVKINVSKAHQYFFSHTILLGDGVKKANWPTVFQKSEKEIKELLTPIKPNLKCFFRRYFLFYLILFNYVVSGEKKLTLRKIAYHFSFIRNHHALPIHTLKKKDQIRIFKQTNHSPNSGAIDPLSLPFPTILRPDLFFSFLKKHIRFYQTLLNYIISGKKRITPRKIFNHFIYLCRFRRLPVHILRPEDQHTLSKEK